MLKKQFDFSFGDRGGVVHDLVLSAQKKKIFFFLKEITNFDDDDMLLVWVITGNGMCEGSYSHTNSRLLCLFGANNTAGHTACWHVEKQV